MIGLVTELKTRARLRLNAARCDAAQRPPKRLRNALNMVSREAGFIDWLQARHVLGGQAVLGDDMGSFWHDRRCNGLLNLWFASHQRARERLTTRADQVLLPYRRQFVVVDANYLREIGLCVDDEVFDAAGRDLAAAYGSAAWLTLCEQRLKLTRGDAGHAWRGA